MSIINTPNNCAHRAGLLNSSEIWEVVRSGVWCPSGWKGTEATSQSSTDQALITRVWDTVAVVLERLDELQRLDEFQKMEIGPIAVDQVRLADITERNHEDIGLYSTTELKCILVALRSLSSPWRKLPVELLIEIFSWCIPSTVLNNSHAPLLLTQISSRWYNVSTNAPSLWSSLTLTENILIQEHADLNAVTKFEAKWQRPHASRLGNNAENFLLMMFNRSRSLPISLTSHSGILLEPNMRSLFYEHASRLKDLALLFPVYDSWQSVPPAPPIVEPFAAPLLETLDIYALQVGSPIFGSRDTNWAAPFAELIRSSISTLRRVNIITYGTPLWPQVELGHTWTKLTHITWRPIISDTEVIKFFHSAPNLVYASFPVIFPLFGRPKKLDFAHPAVLKHLETLIIGPRGMSTVLDAITSPNLRHLVHLAPSNDDKNALIAFFRRSAPPLETLYLYHTSYNCCADLLEVLENVEGGNSEAQLQRKETKNGHLKGKETKKNGHLKALLITDSHLFHALLSDKLFERLTWIPQEKYTMDLGTDPNSRISDVEDCSVNDVLFPGVEYLSFYDIGSTTPGKLPEMLRSRMADPSAQTHHVAKLKMFETWHQRNGLNHVVDGDWEEVEALRHAGLVLRLFKSSDSAPCMTTAEKDLLEHYVKGGLVVRDYMHDIGRFAPIEL